MIVKPVAIGENVQSHTETVNKVSKKQEKRFISLKTKSENLTFCMPLTSK